MRRLTVLLLCLFCVICLGRSVAAAEETTAIQVYATIDSNGSCQVSVTAHVHLDTANPSLLFPVPPNASSITLNGAGVRTQKTDDARLIDLSALYGTVVGDISFAVQYTLRDVIESTASGGLELRLFLINGFSYPVDELKFSLTLPGEISARPAFLSGYHQSGIEKDISCTVSGNLITGQTSAGLKDHETLTLLLSVEEAMFPQPIIRIYTSDIDDLGIALFSILGLLYWLLVLRCVPPRKSNCTTPPEGYNAGQMGTILGLQSADLSLMVLSWAQLGYLYISPNRNSVVLFKRMDMGNERSDFELRCFKSLFAKGDRVDCSGYRYALQCQKVAHAKPDLRDMVNPHSGNRRVFRFLFALCGLFAGIGMGLSLGSGGILQPVFAVGLSFLGAYVAWNIQNWASCLFLYNRQNLLFSLALSALWIILAFFAGELRMGMLLIALEFLAGLLSYYGGRRTESGRQAIARTLGFRRYLSTVSRQELDRISRNHPDYFFDLAPYAVALGVGKAFARQFGTKPFRECPYIEFRLKETITAARWNKIIEDTLDRMNTRNRRTPFQHLSRSLRRLTK